VHSARTKRRTQPLSAVQVSRSRASGYHGGGTRATTRKSRSSEEEEEKKVVVVVVEEEEEVNNGEGSITTLSLSLFLSYFNGR